MNAIPKKRGDFAVVQKTDSSELKRLTLSKLAGSKLDEKDAKRMELRLVTGEQCVVMRLPSATDGFLIPYFDLDGKQTEFFRVRYMKDTRKGFEMHSGKKAMRYGQVPGTINEAYLPPLGINWAAIAADPSQRVVITEGELKAACATKHGVPTIGLGGVWCFTSAKHGLPLLPIFDSFVWERRDVVICFDSDASTNLDISRAENVLATRLGEYGATVRIARIPAEGDAKVGIDDYIVAHGPESWVDKVIEKAQPFDSNAALHQMNEQVVYVRVPGAVWVYKDEQLISSGDYTGHAFSNVWHTESHVVQDDKGNNRVQVKRVLTAKQWMQWPYRAELRGMTFRPGEPQVTEGRLNTWRGWGFPTPAQGDITPWQELLNHVFGEELALRQWFERWAAYPIQSPGYKQANAVLVWGVGEGTGKTMIGHTLMTLYGDHATELKDSDLENDRNEWASVGVQFALADDITGRDSRRLANRLKTMVTQKEIRVDPKYIKSYTLPDTINYYFTSNDPNALSISSGDRRYMIHEVIAGMLPKELAERVVAWRETPEGRAALAWHLLNLPMGEYNPKGKPPTGEAKESMAMVSKSDLGLWCMDFAANVDDVLAGAGYKGDIFTVSQLSMLFDPTGERRMPASVMGMELKRAGFSGAKAVKTSSGVKRLLAVRNVARWNDATGAAWAEHYEANNPEIGKKGKKF